MSRVCWAILIGHALAGCAVRHRVVSLSLNANAEVIDASACATGGLAVIKRKGRVVADAPVRFKGVHEWTKPGDEDLDLYIAGRYQHLFVRSLAELRIGCMIEPTASAAAE